MRLFFFLSAPQLQPWGVGVLWYLDDADGLPGKVEAGVEQEGEDQGEGLVPAQARDRQR